LSSPRWPLLAFILVLALTSPGQAKPVPLMDLTQDLIRTQVESYLAEDAAKKTLVVIRGLARLSPTQITYEAADGKPKLLLWTYQSLKDKLDEVETSAVAAALEDTLNKVLHLHMGGLLSQADTKKVLA